MQPDGTLNPSPITKDNPDPSDSDASYWLARTLWAYGEGYAAFRHSDPAFAAFLAARMALSLRALNRDVLTDYGKYQVLHGVRVPAWLIGDGADASSEAALGIAAYVKAGGPGAGTATHRARRADPRHHRTVRRQHHHIPVPSPAAVGAVPLAVARLGCADGQRPGRGLPVARAP